eukprot:TRINITY_DN81058_c0_g1_i1.p1 TRINITY_DN81058_c0_g1~~TRINITY_DN81058_c0_g1_i1.p1  ORF type:complete len:270 (-),score=83.21 TRINITY_DN81058_c0_g1_i1:875-1684(-)
MLSNGSSPLGQMDREPGSPMRKTANAYMDRLSRLSDRLNGLQTDFQTEKETRFQQLQTQLQDVDGRLQNASEAMHGSSSLLKEAFVDYERAFREEQQQQSMRDDAAAKELISVDGRLHQCLRTEQAARREMEGSLLAAFDQKTALIREELEKEARSGAQAEAAFKRHVEVDIPQLYENLSQERKSRETMEERLVSRASEEIRRLQQAVAQERKVREDIEEAMVRRMEEAIGSLQADLQQERAQREATEEHLLKLLEQTTHKLETAAHLF